MSNLTHVKKLQDPNYLGAYELITDWVEGKAIWKPLTVTINRVVQEKTKTQNQEIKAVCYFEECKPLILNVINRKNIVEVIGSPMDEHWKGKKIVLGVERINNRITKEWEDVIRVIKQKPVIEKPNFTPSHERWNGAKQSIADGNTTIEAIKKHYTLTAENEKLLCTKSD